MPATPTQDAAITPGQTQGASSTGPSGQTEGSSGSSTLPTDFDAALVTPCETIIESFRRGKVRKAEAATQLYRALQIDEVVDVQVLREREQAYETFFEMLDQIDRDRRDTGSTPRADPSLGEQRGALPQPGLREASPPVLPEEAEVDHARSGGQRDLLSRLTDPTSPGKRRREAEDTGDSDEEDFDSDRRHKPKRPIDESLFPFTASDTVEALSDILQRTLLLKENYTRDLTLAKQRVVCSPGCPPIPDSVWSDVLANRYVDLDKIFSAVYTIDGDHKSSVKLGDLELVGFPSKPKRHVERHGHWTVAWALYQRAVLYVYPHREPELRAYYDQINSFFAAVSEFEASRVVNLDRAIRGEVGRSNTLLLSDFSRFNHLYTMHVVGAGAATQSSPSNSANPRRSGVSKRAASSEACIRFNEG